MVYLDYAATTPVDKRVLESFDRTCIEYIANPNSLHSEGVKSRKLMEAAVNQVASLLNVHDNEVIFTSGATESNNLAITGVINKYKDRGKTIITTKLEHSSILETVNYLEKNGYIIKYVKLDSNGLVDLNNLKELLTDDVVMVSVCEVNSEIGITENIKEISEILKDYPRIIFHVDGTGAIGKKHIDLTNIDLYSFSAHKIYGLKGVGVLVKKEHISLEPLIHGGKSQSNFRAGTPALPLIVSTARALKLILSDLDYNINYVKELSDKLKEGLSKIDGVSINSNNYSSPYIVNFSVIGIKPETILHALEEDEIYISTKTACSSDDYSVGVFELTNDIEKAKSSLRVSLSHLTKENEIDKFLSKLEEKIIKLKSIKNE
jgi:cysteine desulfurase